MEYFAVLTVVRPLVNGQEYLTMTRTVTVSGPDPKRVELFEWMLDQLPEHLHGRVNVLFFSAEPNLISTGAAGAELEGAR